MIDNPLSKLIIKMQKSIFRIFFLFVFCCLFSLSLSAQVDDVVNSGKYIYGTMNKLWTEADQKALQDLVSQISVSVESWFSNVEKEINQDGKLTSVTSVESVVKTYSNISSLPFVERIPLSYGPNFKVCRCIEKSEVDRIFTARRMKMNSFLELAQRNESQSKIGTALQNYYWAYCLLKSLPRANDLTNDNGDILMTWIPNEINTILGDIRATKEKKEGNDVVIEVLYKDFPVVNLDFTYFDGRNRTNYLTSVTDGKGVMEMVKGASTESLKINVEYEYKDEAVRDEEMAAVLNVMKPNSFPKSVVKVTGKFKSGKEKDEEESYDVNMLVLEAMDSKNETSLNILEEQDNAQYAKVMDAVVKAVKAKNYDGVSRYFTERGRDRLTKLLKYGNAKVVTNPDFAFIRFGDEVICRSLMMSFAFKNNTRTFIENVNFTFNRDGLIDWIAFGLNDEDARSILLHEYYSETARVLLTQFLENYKTAYALKDLEYIRDIFDDNALIITGTVVKPASYTNKERKRYYESEKIKYNRYSKAEYLTKLEKTFKSNEFVNIRFADLNYEKAGKKMGEVYGIRIKQDYYSSNYGDTGYLYLQVDFNESDRPLIQVRTWQPESVPLNELFGLGDF